MPCDGSVGKRVDRQQVDPGGRRHRALGGARAHRGAERLREAQQAEIVHLHLGARGLGAAIRDAVGAMEFGGVDQDIDLAADHAGEIAHRSLVGDVERHDLDLLGVELRRLLPRLRDADPDDVGAGLDQRPRQRLPDRALAVGDQHLAEFRIAGHLAQHRIVRHVRRILRRQRDQHRLSALVEMRAHAHASAACNRHADARAGSAPRRAAPVRAATARARDSKARSSDAARCRRSARPRRRSRAIRAGATGTCGMPRAADTAPCAQSKQCCSSKRPSAAAAVSRSAARLRAPGGKVGSRNARTGLRGFGLLSGSVMRHPGSRRRRTARDRS